MNNEIMTKMNEALKKDGRQELNMEDLGNVVGGSFSYSGGNTCILNGTSLTISEFNNLFMSMAELNGFSTASAVLGGAAGYTCPEMTPEFDWGPGKTNTEKMNIVLNRFWVNHAVGSRN